MATTVITDETVTISLRMGATLSMAAIGNGTADIVYTLPGEAEQTDELAGTVERVYGPYPFGQDFAITATDSVQAVTTFGTIAANATIQQVDSLPSLGAPNVIYQTATAAYWWNGVAFIAMGSGAAGSFTSLAVSGAAVIGGNVTTSGDFVTTADQFVRSSNGGAVAAGLLLKGSTGEIIPYFGGVASGSMTGSGYTVAGYLAGAEQTAPDAPAANGYRIFAQDNGAGKTQLMVIFASGAAQQLAIEP